MDFEKQIQTDRESLIQDIMKLVSIDSVETAPDAGMPFGAGAAKALDCFLETAESIGLKTENFDHYAGHADYGSGRNSRNPRSCGRGSMQWQLGM